MKQYDKHLMTLTAEAECRHNQRLIDEGFARADTMAQEEVVLTKLRQYGAFEAQRVARLEEVAG
jgi:hypothetical protein